MARPALAATRAIEIINFCAAHPTESFTLSDFVERLGINVASLHAILAVLTQSGYLARHSRHRTYTLGPALVAVGTAALEHHASIEFAREEARRLSEHLDLDVAVTARAGDEVVFVARSGSHRPRGTPTHVGMRMPLRPPMGSIFYAWSDGPTVETWLRSSPAKSGAELDRYRRELVAVRARGYSVALEVDLRRELGHALEELTERPHDAARGAVDQLVDELGRQGNHLETIDPNATYDVSSIAGAVFDASSQVALALNLIGFAPGLTGKEVAAYGDEVVSAGVVISKRTRGQPPTELLAGVSADDGA